MNTLLIEKLAQIKVQEMLQEAADARASRAEDSPSGSRKFRFAMTVTAAVVLWILWMLVIG